MKKILYYIGNILLWLCIMSSCFMIFVYTFELFTVPSYDPLGLWWSQIVEIMFSWIGAMIFCGLLMLPHLLTKPKKENTIKKLSQIKK